VAGRADAAGLTRGPAGLSAAEQPALVGSGEVSAPEPVQALLDAVERDNARLKWFVALAAEYALAEADRVLPGAGACRRGEIVVGKTNMPELGMRRVTGRFGSGLLGTR
jgi:Asp-tRNA(Asn)/Glu-tRNA(Gln) amidotransferase A subunit family amidase